MASTRRPAPYPRPPPPDLRRPATLPASPLLDGTPAEARTPSPPPAKGRISEAPPLPSPRLRTSSRVHPDAPSQAPPGTSKPQSSGWSVPKAATPLASPDPAPSPDGSSQGSPSVPPRPQVAASAYPARRRPRVQPASHRPLPRAPAGPLPCWPPPPSPASPPRPPGRADLRRRHRVIKSPPLEGVSRRPLVCAPAARDAPPPACSRPSPLASGPPNPDDVSPLAGRLAFMPPIGWNGRHLGRHLRSRKTDFRPLDCAAALSGPGSWGFGVRCRTAASLFLPSLSGELRPLPAVEPGPV